MSVCVCLPFGPIQQTSPHYLFVVYSVEDPDPSILTFLKSQSSSMTEDEGLYWLRFAVSVFGHQNQMSVEFLDCLLQSKSPEKPIRRSEFLNRALPLLLPPTVSELSTILKANTDTRETHIDSIKSYGNNQNNTRDIGCCNLL